MAPSTLHFNLIKGPHLTSKPTQRFWQKCPTKFRSGGFWHPKYSRIQPEEFESWIFCVRWNGKELELGTYPSPPMGFPEILVGKLHRFFLERFGCQNESLPCLGGQISGRFPSGNLNISVFLAGYVSSLEIAHTLLPFVPARWRWIGYKALDMQV